jgi:hypothetical protein
MTEKQKEFLRLAVVEKLSYDEIAIKLKIDRNLFAPWWNELKEEREYLTIIRDKRQIKCPEIDFDVFKTWFETTEKKCFYCDITEGEITELWERHPNLTKRNRGKKLEIERLEPNLPYNNLENLVFSCYWCNNAKTDTFTKDEFIIVGRAIKQIWIERLK